MRIKGKLEKWNDDRGFGFIKPLQDHPPVFVHISEFTMRPARPQVGQIFVFQIEKAADGRTRAINVVRAGVGNPQVGKLRPPWGAASFLTIPAFIVLYLAVAMIWRVPPWVGGGYLAVSSLCLFYYAKDKSAAAAGSWRVPEGFLHLLGVAGGWPGAIIAQQLLRHKSRKEEFRAVFWASVIANVVGFVLCFTPVIAVLRRSRLQP